MDLWVLNEYEAVNPNHIVNVSRRKAKEDGTPANVFIWLSAYTLRQTEGRGEKGSKIPIKVNSVVRLQGEDADRFWDRLKGLDKAWYDRDVSTSISTS